MKVCVGPSDDAFIVVLDSLDSNVAVAIHFENNTAGMGYTYP